MARFKYSNRKQGRILPVIPEEHGVKNMHGHIGRQYVQKDGDCALCHLRSQCLQKNWKRRNLFIVDIPKPMTSQRR